MILFMLLLLMLSVLTISSCILRCCYGSSRLEEYHKMTGTSNGVQFNDPQRQLEARNNPSPGMIHHTIPHKHLAAISFTHFFWHNSGSSTLTISLPTKSQLVV